MPAGGIGFKGRQKTRDYAMNMRAAEAIVSSAPKPMKIFPISEVWSQVELSLLATAGAAGSPARSAASCPQGGEFNPSLGECQCADGTAYSSYTGTPCQAAGGADLTGQGHEFFALARTAVKEARPK